MFSTLKRTLLEVLKAMVPVTGIVCVLQLAVVHAPAPMFAQFLAGAVLAIAGMVLLLIGVDLGILPMGKFIGCWGLPRPAPSSPC